MVCCNFNAAFIVFKSFTLDIGSARVNAKAMSFEIFQEVDDRNHLSEC